MTIRTKVKTLIGIVKETPDNALCSVYVPSGHVGKIIGVPNKFNSWYKVAFDDGLVFNYLETELLPI